LTFCPVAIIRASVFTFSSRLILTLLIPCQSLASAKLARSMTEDQERHMLLGLLGLEEKLAGGPVHVSAQEIADIGAEASPSLNEIESYRLVNRLHRQDKIIGIVRRGAA